MTDLGIYGDSIAEQKNGARFEREQAETLELCKRNLCPACGGSDICGYEVEIIKGTAQQNCDCSSCNAEWTEFYTLSSFDITTKGDHQ